MSRPGSCLLALCIAVPTVAAQEWRGGAAIALVERAAALRAARDADTLLAGWQAVASGMVRFAVITDHGAGSTERVFRADELRVEVYGEAPNRSKQQIVAWRDTTFAPTRIIYHRDHLGIVANDFGPVIRLGQGDEVRDVPHPLSPVGLRHYEFRTGDTVAVSGQGGAVRVVSIAVRPRDPAAAGTIGTLFFDADRAALVRFAFTFTAASYRDPTVSTITVELENALLDGRHWLPWRQAITIKRASPLLALPLHTILRADWRIGDYRLGVAHPPGRFTGPLVDGLRAPGGPPWETGFETALAGLPATGLPLEELSRYADALAPDAVLDGLPRLRLLGARGMSSLLRINRVQGVTPGVGLRIGLGDRSRLDLAAAVGTADGRVTGQADLRFDVGRGDVSLTVGREVVDVADGSFGSGLANSIATAVAGDDAGDWLWREYFSEAAIRGGGAAFTWRVAGTHERIRSLDARFTALDGTRRENPALGVGQVSRWSALVASRDDGAPAGWRVAGEVGAGAVGWGRAVAELRGTLARVGWRIEAGVGTRDLPGYRSFVVGGRGTLVGVSHRSIGGRRLARVEVALPLAVRVPAPGLGRFAAGMLTSRVTPYLAAAVAGGGVAGVPWRATGTIEPVVGVRLDLWGPLLRLEAGWAVRQGGLGVTLDAHPDWWSML